MGLKESGLRGSLRNVSVGIDAIPDRGIYLDDWQDNKLTDRDSYEITPLDPDDLEPDDSEFDDPRRPDWDIIDNSGNSSDGAEATEGKLVLKSDDNDGVSVQFDDGLDLSKLSGFEFTVGPVAEDQYNTVISETNIPADSGFEFNDGYSIVLRDSGDVSMRRYSGDSLQESYISESDVFDASTDTDVFVDIDYDGSDWTMTLYVDGNEIDKFTDGTIDPSDVEYSGLKYDPSDSSNDVVYYDYAIY